MHCPLCGGVRYYVGGPSGAAYSGNGPGLLGTTIGGPFPDDGTGTSDRPPTDLTEQAPAE